MSTSSRGESDKKYRGVRRRKWGKWVSEIRVPGSQERIWLGSYSCAEAAAVAHDIALFSLRGPSSMDSLNFPTSLPAGLRTNLSPTSIQRAASDAGMAIDAQMQIRTHNSQVNAKYGEEISQGSDEGDALSISVEDYL